MHWGGPPFWITRLYSRTFSSHFLFVSCGTMTKSSIQSQRRLQGRQMREFFILSLSCLIELMSILWGVFTPGKTVTKSD
ncbi:hypothetical protein TNCT_718481 [Trichonephila clavata]|uniref:Uncharacterized protein n=1 Tax=Trichonephila clavata TaxID=2740835 RepID=A0A8X6KUE4_TRICU|nr:hypothetical protein TNCT_718481 [Trichonephila clavata]